MAEIRVSPTRMELLRLKKRTALAQKGHKLLKEKRDGLMQEFLKIIRQAQLLRREVDKQLGAAQAHFAMAEATMTPQMVHLLQFIQPHQASLDVRIRNVMGVEIPDFTIQLEETTDQYSAWETSPGLDEGMATFREVLIKLLELAGIEKSAQLLAQEIERTRRRVNALEYVLLPQLTRTTRYIRMKLDEQERAAITTTMAVKRQMV